jgi:hypothetical protein
MDVDQKMIRAYMEANRLQRREPGELPSSDARKRTTAPDAPRPAANVTDMDRAQRILAGRAKHGVGMSSNFPGNVSHLVSPLVGTLRLRERDGETLTADEIAHYIDRLSLVLDMARQETEDAEAGIGPVAEAERRGAEGARLTWPCCRHCPDNPDDLPHTDPSVPHNEPCTTCLRDERAWRGGAQAVLTAVAALDAEVIADEIDSRWGTDHAHRLAARRVVAHALAAARAAAEQTGGAS